jgi:hypothetical protein
MPKPPLPNGKTINSVDATPTSPVACVFQNSLFLFWKANDPSNRIYFSASAANSQGYPQQSWPNGKTINNADATPAAPAACVFQNQLFLFWKANDPSNRIYFSASSDGKNWPNGATINTTDSSPNALAACVFQNQLFLFWKANDPSNRIYFSASADGKSWPSGATINSTDSSLVAPAACVFPTPPDYSTSQLCLLWSGPSNRIFFSSSANGLDWSKGTTINNVDSTPASVAALTNTAGGSPTLDLFWKANDPSNLIYSSGSFRIGNWPAGVPINNVDATPTAVATCQFEPGPGLLYAVYLFWKANDPSNRIYYSGLPIIT